MDPTNGESSKRNGKDVVEAMETPRYHPMHEQPKPYVSTELCLGIGSSETTQNNNAKSNAWPDLLSAAAFEPPTYTSFVREQNGHVDQCMCTVQSSQGGAAKRWRERDMQLQEVEERAAKRRREKEEQLWHEAIALREENEVLRKRVSELEQKVEELEQHEEEEEEGESSCSDPSGLEPLLLKCRICARRRVAVMLWPCRHFCVCQACDLTLTRCPVCDVIKTSIFNVRLPR